MERHKLIIVDNALLCEIEIATMFPFIAVGFEHAFDDSFSPSYSSKTLFGVSLCLVIFCHGCSKVFR